MTVFDFLKLKFQCLFKGFNFDGPKKGACRKKAAREGFQANSAFCNLLLFFAWDDKLIKKDIDRESERERENIDTEIDR